MLLRQPVHVLDVFEEQHLGQESIVTWAGGPPFVGFIVINFLSRESDPDAPVTQLAVAFEPGAAYTRIEPEDIATHWAVLPLDPFVGVVETEYFDEEGNEIDYTGAQNPVATLGPIR